jgi:hypothetical protein
MTLSTRECNQWIAKQTATYTSQATHASEDCRTNVSGANKHLEPGDAFRKQL